MLRFIKRTKTIARHVSEAEQYPLFLKRNKSRKPLLIQKVTQTFIQKGVQTFLSVQSWYPLSAQAGIPT